MNARFVMVGAFVAAAALAACGGGGGGSTTPSTPKPTPTPTPTGSVTQTITFSGSTQNVTLPTNPAGVTGQVTVPAGNGSATFTYSLTAPATPGAISVAHRAPITVAASRRVATASASSNVGVLYVTISGTATMTGVPGFIVTLPSTVTATIPSGAQFYVGYYNPNTQAWQSSSTTGATLSGANLTVAATTAPTFAISTGNPAYLVVYYGYFIPTKNINGCVGIQTQQDLRRQLVGVEPPTANSTWTYSGTLTTSSAQGTPCPVPTATSNATVTVDVTVTSSPGLPAGFVDEHSVETDSFTTNTTQVTTDAAVNGKYEVNETSTDLSLNKVVTTYGGSGLTYYIAGQGFANVPPASINTTFADGTTYARTYASGGVGAYSETDKLAGITNTDGTLSVNTNGAASYDIVNIAPNATPAPIPIAMSAPSGGNITINFDAGGTILTIPAWYATPLYSDTTVSNGSQPISSQCQNATYTGATGDEYVRTLVDVDPALGTIENETITTWIVPNYQTSGKTVGPVCVLISDTQNIYYDFLLNTVQIYVSGNKKPLITNTYNEVYSFNAAPVGFSRVREDEAAQAAAAFALHQSGLAFTRSVERAQRLELLERAASSGHLEGIVR